jgi:hypothetical protein
MQITPPHRHALTNIAGQLDRAASGIANGARLLRDTQLEGQQWRTMFDATIRQVGGSWGEPWDAIAAARTGAARLREHPASTEARAIVASAAGVANAGLERVARGMMNLPPDLTRDEAGRVLRSIAAISDQMVAGLEDASRAIAQLARL